MWSARFLQAKNENRSGHHFLLYLRKFRNLAKPGGPHIQQHGSAKFNFTGGKWQIKWTKLKNRPQNIFGVLIWKFGCLIRQFGWRCCDFRVVHPYIIISCSVVVIWKESSARVEGVIAYIIDGFQLIVNDIIWRDKIMLMVINKQVEVSSK